MIKWFFSFNLTLNMKELVGSHLLVGVYQGVLSVRYNVSENGTVINPTAGLEYNLLTTLATVLNFSFTLVDKSSMTYGKKDENGSWIGTVGEIVRGELDLAMCTFTITSERMEAVDFTPSFLRDHAAFFIKPQIRSEKKGIFFSEPFTIQTWILVFVYLIIYALLLRILFHSRCNLNVPTFILANILGQGYVLRIPKNHRHIISTTILLVFWFTTSTIIVIYYGTSLTSSASFHDDFAINTLKELMPYFERGEMKIGIQPGTHSQDWHWTTGMINVGKYQDIVKVDWFDNLLELMLEGKVAILASAKYLMLRMHERGLENKYHLVNEWVSYENLAMPVRKNFTYKKQFARIINILMATGCFKKWENDLTFDFQRSERKKKLLEKDGYSPINPTDFKSAFILGFAGLLICFLIFNAERVIKMYRDRRMVQISENIEQETRIEN